MGQLSDKSTRVDRFDTAPFISGPAEVLVSTVVAELKKIPEWVSIFGDAIDDYKRMDYGLANLPALRIYNNGASKQAESWFIAGDLIADVIWPASIRRRQLQQLPDIIAGALWNQFRSATFFDAVVAAVPGLNELGKVLSVDKSLGFEWGDQIVPLTQFTINFRLDLRIWDDFLDESGREKDTPFQVSFGTLKEIVDTLQALKDDGTTETEISSSITLED